MKLDDDGTITLNTREVQQAIVEWLASRSLVAHGRPYRVTFDVPLFGSREDEDDGLRVLVTEGAHG